MRDTVQYKLCPARPPANRLNRSAGLANLNAAFGPAPSQESLHRSQGLFGNRYNVTDWKWDHEVDYCEREGMAFIPWFPLSAGTLGAASVLDRVARRRGATVYQIALAWLLARSPAMLVIPGTSSVEHLEENVTAAEIGLMEEDMTELDRLYSPHAPHEP
jgi:aryl-alcohol dehydrogenase-like predicted oxidoreductase